MTAGSSVEGLCGRCLLELGLESTRTIGMPARIGPYEVLGSLGAGGMGKVYRARDRRLGREVALKVLPEDLAADPDRLARFEREARLLASLNHPHIAAIYGLEDHGAIRCLVLELVEGQTLAQLIQAGPLPIGPALQLCLQVAGALEAAHQKGIVHRDLKPANIMVTANGTVKILDFGVAKATQPLGVGDEPSDLTATGTLIGTAAYMSPEQIRGRPVDNLADIWSFGCLLYEVLSGQQAFGRDTQADTLSAILEHEPPLHALPRSVPPAVRTLIVRALQKDPDRRLREIREASRQLQDALTALTEATTTLVRPPPASGPAIARYLAAATTVLACIALFVFATGGRIKELLDLDTAQVSPILADGGTVALLILAVVTSLATIWEGLKIARRRVSWVRLRLGSSLLALGLYILLLVGSLFTRHFYTAGILAVCGPTLAVARVRRHASVLGTSALFTALVVITLVSSHLEGRWLARAGRLQDDRLDVYVVLPFERLNDEQKEELRDISEHYRATLETIFSDLESVRIMPEVFDAHLLRSLSPQCSYRRAREWLEETRLSADVVFCSKVDLFDDEARHSGVMLVSTVNRVDNGLLEPMGGHLKQAAAYADIGWLALRGSFRVLKALQELPALALSAEDELRAKKRILQEYGVFLSFREHSADAAAALDRALRQRALADGDVESALDAYRSPVDLARYASRHADVRDALTRKVIGE